MALPIHFQATVWSMFSVIIQTLFILLARINLDGWKMAKTFPIVEHYDCARKYVKKHEFLCIVLVWCRKFIQWHVLNTIEGKLIDDISECGLTTNVMIMLSIILLVVGIVVMKNGNQQFWILDEAAIICVFYWIGWTRKFGWFITLKWFQAEKWSIRPINQFIQLNKKENTLAKWIIWFDFSFNSIKIYSRASCASSALLHDINSWLFVRILCNWLKWKRQQRKFRLGVYNLSFPIYSIILLFSWVASYFVTHSNIFHGFSFVSYRMILLICFNVIFMSLYWAHDPPFLVACITTSTAYNFCSLSVLFSPQLISFNIWINTANSALIVPAEMFLWLAKHAK